MMKTALLSLALTILTLNSYAKAPATAPNADARVVKKFTIYNALLYKNTPDLTSRGIHDVTLIYEGALTLPPPSGVKERGFSESMIAAEAILSKAKPNGPISLDIESWKFDSEGTDKYIKSINVFKSKRSDSAIGYYGIYPFDNYLLYKSVNESNPLERIQWEAIQNRVLPVAEAVDIYMPSLYTWGNDLEAWKSTAKIVIQKARSLDPNKPIYAFIWPQYYDSKQPYALQFIDAETWRSELETLYQLADGVIIWSNGKDSKNRPVQFSESMPWFMETQEFIKAHNLN